MIHPALDDSALVLSGARSAQAAGAAQARAFATIKNEFKHCLEAVGLPKALAARSAAYAAANPTAALERSPIAEALGEPEGRFVFAIDGEEVPAFGAVAGGPAVVPSVRQVVGLLSALVGLAEHADPTRAGAHLALLGYDAPAVSELGGLIDACPLRDR